MIAFGFRSDLACDIALDATQTVATEDKGHREIDIKRYAKVEKVSGRRSISIISSFYFF